MIKHGMKTNNIRHAITMRMNTKSHPTKKIPINAMPILYVFYVLIATILLRTSQFLGSVLVKRILVLHTSFLINLNSQK